MSNKKRIGLVLLAALIGFSCAPTLSPALAPTLDPLSMSTAIAQTAGAASAQTAVVDQPEVQASPAVVAAGPTLDPLSLNTAIAQTAAVAASQTAALIPNTLTPSATLPPTETPSITPSPTATFILVIPTNTAFKVDIPKPTATKKGKKGKDDGGGGGGGGGGSKEQKTYTCSVLSVSPANYSIIPVNQLFTVQWTVKNTGDTWDANSVDLVPVEGNLIRLTDGYDLVNGVDSGKTIILPGVAMLAPSTPGKYGTHWRLMRGEAQFCDMYLIVNVE